MVFFIILNRSVTGGNNLFIYDPGSLSWSTVTTMEWLVYLLLSQVHNLNLENITAYKLAITIHRWKIDLLVSTHNNNPVYMYKYCK